jgi:hypothetical protein
MHPNFRKKFLKKSIVDVSGGREFDHEKLIRLLLEHNISYALKVSKPHPLENAHGLKKQTLNSQDMSDSKKNFTECLSLQTKKLVPEEPTCLCYRIPNERKIFGGCQKMGH